MNPALANRTGLGASFKGLGLYLLHDKRPDHDHGDIHGQASQHGQTKGVTAHRVGFVETRNLATDDGDRAWKLMIATASRAEQLKRLAGVKATGRRLEKPVLHYALNWHPSEKPTREQMMAAVEASLAALGLSDHEALIVQHREMAHDHVHIMVNRVHPETGIAAKLSNSRLVLDKWADQYERENGNIVSPNRKEKYDALARGEKATSKRQWLPHDEWMQKKAAAQARAKAWADYRDDDAALRQAQQQEARETKAALYADTRQKAASARLTMRGHYRDQWRQLYAGQDADHRALKGIRNDSDAIRFINSRADLLKLGIERIVSDQAQQAGKTLTTAGFRRAVDDTLVMMKTARHPAILEEIVKAAHGDQKAALAHNAKLAQDKAAEPYWQAYGDNLRQLYARQHHRRNALRMSHGYDPQPQRPYEDKPQDTRQSRDVRAMTTIRADKPMPQVTGLMPAPAPAPKPKGAPPAALSREAEALRRKWREAKEQARERSEEGRERIRQIEQQQPLVQRPPPD